MKRIHLKAAILALGMFALGFIHPVAAQQPNTLKHFIPGSTVGGYSGAQFGRSVAIDGELTVVGAPADDLGGNESGVVKVFNSSTGALLHVIPNPTPGVGGQFGTSVGISGTRVVVGSVGDQTGSAYVYDLASGTPTEPAAELSNPGSGYFDKFGSSVAISGTRVVVGAYLETSDGISAGSAYVYDLASGTPTVRVATLNNPSPDDQDHFGYSVAISGTRIVVGAYNNGAGASGAGSAYVYDLTSVTPTNPVATLNNPGPAEIDRFGWSVAISGTRVVVGAIRDDTGAEDAGSAYVYDVAGGTPTMPLATLNNPSPADQDFFGYSVAISGTRVVVGAGFNDEGASNAGSAYVYDLVSGNPVVPVATLNNPTPATNDQFGISVAISGTRVVVGAYDDDTAAQDSGNAYIYDVASGPPAAPTVSLNIPSPAANDKFGFSVAISGTRMVVGRPFAEYDAGCAFVYDLASGTPTLPVAILYNPTPAAGDRFGTSVAIFGTRVVVGADGDDSGASDAGSAYVYELASWTPTVPVATLKNPTPAANDSFGNSVAISGARVVVGAVLEDTGAINAGSAYVYDLAGGTPTVPVATLINPSAAANDRFGISVAISGMRVVVGASQDDSGATDAGSAYVYDLASGTPTVPVVTLNNPSPAADDQFGISVAISGTRAVVGAFLDNTGAIRAGSAYVYDLASGTPAEPVTTLNNPGPAVGDGFGYSVAIAGTRVVVGAVFDDSGASDAGSAYAYDLASGTQTVPVATLNNPSAADSDRFGFAVAISGSLAVIGAPFDDSPEVDNGYAYVFGPAETNPPTGGSFTITPASPVIPGTSLTGIFAGWSDVSNPLTYEVLDYGGVIVVAADNPSPTFTLREGEHSITGRVYDAGGSYIDFGPVKIVVDGSAPTITTPGDMIIDANVYGGAVVNFSVSAVDDYDANPTVTANPPSGSIFPLGFTTVTVTARDNVNNESIATFTVRVRPESPFATMIAEKGSSVPGAGIDPRIASATGWTTLATPAINDAGQIAYLGKWEGGAPVYQFGVGIFMNDTLVAKVGDAVPAGGNIPANAIFKTLRDPVITGAGHVTFLATIAGTGISSSNDSVVMSTAGDGVLKVLAREGAEAPGTGGAKFKSFANVSALGTPSGGTLFTASLKVGSGNPKTTSANDTGAWILPFEGNALVKLLREGDPGFTAGETIKTFTVLSAVSGSPGHGRGHSDDGDVAIRVTLGGGPIPRQAMVVASSFGVRKLAATGDLLGGNLPLVTWKTMNMPSPGNEGYRIAVLGSLALEAGVVTNANAKGIFECNDGGETWDAMARLGAVATGFGAGEIYSAFFDPVHSVDDSGVAFQGRVKGGTVRGGDNDAIWWRPDDEDLTLLAREGAQPPGAPTGAKWKSFVSLALPGGGAGPIFTATLKSGAGGITPKDDLALYAMDSLGVLREVLRENQPLLNRTDRTVKTFNVLKAVSGTAGGTRAFNAAHQIAVLVTFVGGSSGIVRIDVP